LSNLFQTWYREFPNPPTPRGSKLSSTPSTGFSRRHLLAMLGLSSVIPQVALAATTASQPQPKAKIVIVGGGPGGVATARALRALAPSLSVTLVEPQTTIVTCYFSNHYLGGLRSQASLAQPLGNLTKDGITLVHSRVTDVDRATQTVRLEGGENIPYDKLVLSPGIDFDTADIEGYDRSAFSVMPHAWSGGAQSQLLYRQLHAMPDDGVFIIAPPAMPYRCPPAPYERASLVAHYFKAHKPKAKILILDSKTGFPNQDLFEAAWARYYPGMIDWIPSDFSGGIKAVDPTTLSVMTDGESFTGDVVNIIPKQRANAIARQAGLVDATGWCPINPLSFQSTQDASIHVVGDSIAGHLPKSAFSAALEGTMCAATIAAELRGLPAQQDPFTTACWSLVHPHDGLAIETTYQQSANEFEAIAAGGSALGDTDQQRAHTAEVADVWYATLTNSLYGAAP
jgi:sulfide dehydrogenase [flavocytochrome c] flavoprotein chain